MATQSEHATCTTSVLHGGNTLQHIATHCNTLQHTATRCHALYATHCNTLQHSAKHCNTLQHSATLWQTLQHTATRCHALYATWHKVAPESTIQKSDIKRKQIQDGTSKFKYQNSMLKRNITIRYRTNLPWQRWKGAENSQEGWTNAQICYSKFQINNQTIQLNIMLK